MNKEYEDFLATMLSDGANMFTGIVNSMKNIATARPITISEPQQIDEAIQLYQERIRLLQKLKEQGFDTIAEWTKYKEAQEVIAKHQRKAAGDAENDMSNS